MYRALVRASLNYVPWKARKPVAADLQSIYRASTVAEASNIWRNWRASGKLTPA